jgi:hypothetical protein
MRAALLAALLCTLVTAAPASGGGDRSDGPQTAADRVEELQQDLDSLSEDVEDLQEPVAEFDLFDECMYLIGVSQYGTKSGSAGFLFGPQGVPRPALALDIRGFGRPKYEFLAFPAEEPPSIECNEDAGQESTDN